MSEQAETVIVALLLCQAAGLRPPQALLKQAEALVRERDHDLYVALIGAIGHKKTEMAADKEWERAYRKRLDELLEERRNATDAAGAARLSRELDAHYRSVDEHYGSSR